MKIAILGKFGTEQFGLHIEETFVDMGHDVIRVEPQVNFLQHPLLGYNLQKIAKSFYVNFLDKIPSIRRFTASSIIKKLGKQPLDLVLVLHDFISPPEMDKIKKLTDAPVCLWFPDHLANFQSSMFYVAGYDYLFFKDRYVVDKLKIEFNLNAFYLPQCCNPMRHNKVQLNEADVKEYGCEITNAGNLYPSRAALYKNLTSYDFKLWGGKASAWLTFHELKSMIMGREVFNIEKSKAFSAAKVVLNNLHLAEIDGLNKRTFEVAACGGFQIATFNPAISEHFVIGEEIEVYTSLADLKEKINFYLDSKNESKRLRMIEAGYQRVMRDHTYENRLRQMLQIIFSS